MNSVKKITQDSIKSMIAETAIFLKKKQEIVEKAELLENELKTLNENYKLTTETFGFDLPLNTQKTGFKNSDSAFFALTSLGSEIQLEKEKLEKEMFEKEQASQLEEIDLISEIKKLKEQIQAITTVK